MFVPKMGKVVGTSPQAAVERSSWGIEAVPEERRGRKRAREDDEAERTDKRLKRTESDIGKDWMCNESDCDKRFKTVGLSRSILPPVLSL
jgi:hypothetical protein